MKLQDTFNFLKEKYCSFWQFKERGASLEIITPFATANSKAISLFFTTREDYFIVSDGGWLFQEMYDVDLDFDDSHFTKMFDNYLELFQISQSHISGNTAYFIKSRNHIDLPSMVSRLAQFVQIIVAISVISNDEKEPSKSFKAEANAFITEVKDLITEDWKLEHQIPLAGIRFPSTLRKSNMTVVFSYITGTTTDSFISSAGKTNLNCGIIDKQGYKHQYARKVALINDLSGGYDAKKIPIYLEQLNNVDHQIVWTKREEIKSLIYEL
ncbi:hypothetical protein [Flectobacillus roseus]|uniref:hypothetical protein n=1 Tax=Flectobacillus roseus TaxID=502259 RepID=UPI0024B67027|nr:hypothetical protein [Flectobacillus roseus]MDI9870557.1 hypothetical protein [Flectobacillus roseus]